MAKKGMLASAVETAVKAAEKALAPSPLAKRIVATAASQVIAAAEQRAREAIEPIDKAVQEATKPAGRRAPAKRAPAKSGTGQRKSGGRKSAASRKKTKSSSRSGAARKNAKAKSSRGGKRSKSSKRRRA